MLAFAHSPCLFDKFSGDGKPLGLNWSGWRGDPQAASIPTAAALTRRTVSESKSKTSRQKGGGVCHADGPINRDRRLDDRQFWLQALTYLDKQILPSYGIVLSPSAI